MDIARWLDELGLGQYVEAFGENDIDGEVLRALSNADLIELGVRSLGHRKRILAATAKLTAVTPDAIDPSSWPAILAFPLADYTREPDPVIRLWAACDAVELLLRLVVILGLADLRRCGELKPSLLDDLCSRISHPTLGAWQAMAVAVASEIDTQRSLVPEMPDLVRDVLAPLLDGTSQPQTVRSSFRALRNQLAHGAGVTKSVAADLLRLWAPKFETALSHAKWLQDAHLVAQAEDGSIGTLRGPHSGLRELELAADEATAALRSALTDEQRVVFLRGKSVLPLWPLSLYAPPVSADPDLPPAAEAVPQVYVRRGAAALQFTPIGSEEMCQSEAGTSALDAFLEIFRFSETEKRRAARKFEVRGFESDMRRDAANLVGRTRELDVIRQALGDTKSGVLWVSGPPGIGKSFLLGRIASELLDTRSADDLVLPFRFKSGDDRCSRDAFFRFAIERLSAWVRAEDGGEEQQQKPIDKLNGLLQRAGVGRVILILDAIDELGEKGRAFSEEVPLGVTGPGVLWLCSGRPEHGLPGVFSSDRCTNLFPDGVPPMDERDIRTMLLEKIGPLRKRLLRNDREDNGSIINPFVEAVTRNADGLPIYVRYIIGDILSGRLSVLDARESRMLPPTLAAYHERLLSRCSVGSLQQVLTPLAATLTVAKEPIAVDAIAELLARWNLLPDRESSASLVDRALSAIGSMIRRVTTPDEDDGYTLFHHSLREHMLTGDSTRGPVENAQKNIVAAFTRFDEIEAESLRRYMCRNGLKHAMDSAPELARDVCPVIVNSEYISARLSLPGQSSYSFGLSLIADEPLLEEYRALRRYCSLPPEEQEANDVRLWTAYLQEIRSDPRGGVWLRTLLKRYAGEVPQGVYPLLIERSEFRTLVRDVVESLYSGFGWQAEFGAVAPADFVVRVVRAAGESGAVEFLHELRDVPVGPWGALLGQPGNTTNTLWEQDMRYMFERISGAVTEEIAKREG